jgi:hypothetical protein
MARVSTEVCRTVGSTSASAISAPACAASLSPSGDRSVSYQPVKRFSAFQAL